jgi:hypothetical protein
MTDSGPLPADYNRKGGPYSARINYFFFEKKNSSSTRIFGVPTGKDLSKISLPCPQQKFLQTFFGPHVLVHKAATDAFISNIFLLV